MKNSNLYFKSLYNTSFSKLVCLHSILEYSNVSQAAKRLGYSQPGISSILQTYRDAFKDKLIISNSKTTSYRTENGELIYKELDKLLSAFSSDISKFYQPNQLKNKLSILISNEFSSINLDEFIAIFEKRNIKIDITVMSQASIESLTKTDHFDLYTIHLKTPIPYYPLI